MRQGLAIFVMAVVAGMLFGCGAGGQKATAPVSGTVTHDGEPVSGGSLTFVPIAGSGENEAGKPASGDVGADGTFTLTTYTDGDGAVIGRHRVSYSAPSPETQEAPEGGHVEEEESPYADLVPETSEVEVTSGQNQIEIKLVSESGGGQPDAADASQKSSKKADKSEKSSG